MYRYPDMTKTMTGGGDAGATNRFFILHVENGSFTDSEIIVMLGENGTGKTTFIRMMAGLLKSDEAVKAEEAGDMEKAVALGVPQLNVRYGFISFRQFSLFIFLQLQATENFSKVPRNSSSIIAQKDSRFLCSSSIC